MSDVPASYEKPEYGDPRALKSKRSKRSKTGPGGEAGVGVGVGELWAVRMAPLRAVREINAMGESGLFERPIEGLLETLGMLASMDTRVGRHGCELGHGGQPCPPL